MTLPPPQMVQVTGIQVLLYVLVPAWTLARFRWRAAGEVLFAALVAGLASAALWGRACDGSGIGIAPATAIWLAAWIGAGAWVRRKKRAAVPLRWDGILAAVLLLAWAVRMIHPLQTWALGQSDAYSHLGFLRDVLEKGQVGNGDYPPAYSWVLAFPAWLLPGHPYWMARFGGAFFGAGLALGAYALLAQVRGRAAGLAAAALVAGCPALVLLQKTGVGCFANQLGLLLIPAALWAYVSGRRGWLALALAALAVAVPMMLLHAVLLLGLLVLADRDAGRARFAWLGILALAFALALGIALCLPPARGQVIAAMLTGQYGWMDRAGAGWGDILRTLAADFFAVKRVGYASGALDGLAAATTAAFALALAGGWTRRAAAWRLVGAWGLLTSLNVHLGLFQFTNYQREGWSLLLAAAALGALIFDVLWRTWTSRNGRMVLGAGLAAVSLAGLALPPAHVSAAGPAESDVVRYLLALDPDAAVLARNMSGFESGQGDVVRTLHPKVLPDVAALAAATGPAFFLRDRPAPEPRISPITKILQPGLAAESERAQRRAEADNRRLEEQLAGFEVRKMEYSRYLEVWLIRPEP